MANNVYATLTLHQGNDEVKQWWKDLVSKMTYPEDERPSEYDFYKPIHEMFWTDIDEEFTSTRGWYIDNIGAKWCNIQDADDEMLSTCSAWDIPEYLYERIAEEAYEVDKNVIFTVSYEDEMPNFFGSSVYFGGECFEDVRLESDDFEEYDLEFYWDEDEKGEEQPDDWEASWEQMNDLQWSWIEEAVSNIQFELDV